MSTPKPRRTRKPAARLRSSGATLAPALLVAAVVLGIFFLTQSRNGVAGNGAVPTKPQGNQTNNLPTTETWTPAQGLPAQVMRLAFSSADTERGYAAVFVDKQNQALYVTADGGANWHQSGTVQSPVADIVSTDPRDAQDVVMVSVYAPVPGTYTFQRSLDGGHTWAPQSTDLPTTGTVTQVGWSDSNFLVGFELDGQLHGSSALVAFPKGQPSTHLDVNGKIDGKAIAHLRLLTGHGNKIKVWGDDGSAAHNITGIATKDFGQNWTSLPSSVPGTHAVPAAASDDGSTLLAASTDGQQIAVSSDGGDTWVPQPAFTGAHQANQAVFVTAKSKHVAFTGNDGTYILHNGAWSKVTSKQAVNLSDGGSQHSARLWAYDDHGLVMWLNA